MEANKLKQILAAHALYIKTGGVQGVRADLGGADLKGADLKGADLRGTNIDFSCLPL